MNIDNNNNKDSSGVYFSFLVSEKDSQKLNDFGTHNLGLDMKTSVNEYEDRLHSTLFASRFKTLDVDYLKMVEEKKDESITVAPVGWKLIKSHNTGKTCLALLIYSEELIQAHEAIKNQTGLSHAFSNFITHISLHYDFNLSAEKLKDMPLPDFEITLDRLFTKDYKNSDNHKAVLETKKTEEPIIETKKDIVANIKNIRNVFLNPEPTSNVNLNTMNLHKF